MAEKTLRTVCEYLSTIHHMAKLISVRICTRAINAKKKLGADPTELLSSPVWLKKKMSEAFTLLHFSALCTKHILLESPEVLQLHKTLTQNQQNAQHHLHFCSVCVFYGNVMSLTFLHLQVVFCRIRSLHS